MRGRAAGLIAKPARRIDPPNEIVNLCAEGQDFMERHP